MSKKSTNKAEISIELDKSIGGIPITRFLQASFIVGLLLIVFIIFNISEINRKYSQMSSSVSVYSESLRYTDELQKLSDEMMDYTRMFVYTQDPVFISDYFDIVDGRKRENVMRSFENLLSDDINTAGMENIREALKQSNALMDTEIRAMKLAAEASGVPLEDLPSAVRNHDIPEEDEKLDDSQKMARAMELCVGKKYRDDKDAIADSLKKAGESLSEELQKNAESNTGSLRNAVMRLIVTVILLYIILMGVLIFVSSYIIRPLRLHIQSIREDKKLDIIGAREFRFLSRTFNDMYTQNKMATNELKYSVEHDSLTRICSRELFEKQKERLRDANTSIALLMIDVDYFKSINDKYGHEVGDTALVRVADTLKRAFRSNDIVARIGGDEFAVILLDVGLKDKEQIVTKLKVINDLLSNPIKDEVSITLSMGLAFSERGYTQELFHHADEAMYITKKNGRNGYTVYEDSVG